jgi:DNA-binding NtrC family response regulator
MCVVRTSESRDFKDASRTLAPTARGAAGEKSTSDRELFAMQTILVVDDEPLIRWAIREVLEDAGYAVVEAGTAKEAVGHMNGSGPFAVALLDLRLPDCDDLTLLRRVRREAPQCQVVLMTAHGTSEVMAEAIGAGAFRAVSKPFDLSRVVGIVREAEAAA